MLRFLIPLVTIGLLGLGTYFVLRGLGRGVERVAQMEIGARDDAEGDSPNMRTELDPSLDGRQRTPRPARSPRRRRPRVLPTDQLPRGGIDVSVLGPDGEPLPGDVVRVTLERVGPAFFVEPMGRFAEDTKVWSFRDVPTGKVKVTVKGDHVVDATASAQIHRDRVATVEVFADLAGAIEYEAVLFSGKRPETVTLKLLDATTEKPVSVRYQVRSPTQYTSDRFGTEVTQGPQGIVFGIPPGTYVLHATSPAGEVDQVGVRVEVGRTQKVKVELRF